MFTSRATTLFSSVALAVSAVSVAAPAVATAKTNDSRSMPTIEITATADSLRTNTTELRPGWTRVVLTNTDRQPHQASLIGLPKGTTTDQFFARFTEEGERALAGTTAAGGPAVALPGASTSVMVNLSAGTYVAADLVPGADGRPKATKGFVTSFAVKAALGARPSARPNAATTVELHDFLFKGNVKLKRGSVLGVRNDGKQPHELVMFSLAPGRTVRDVIDFFGNPAPSGPPPFTGAIGIAGIAPKATGYLPIDLPAGKVALLCFLPDATGKGEPHFARGMLGEGEIVG